MNQFSHTIIMKVNVVGLFRDRIFLGARLWKYPLELQLRFLRSTHVLWSVSTKNYPEVISLSFPHPFISARLCFNLSRRLGKKCSSVNPTKFSRLFVARASTILWWNDSILTSSADRSCRTWLNAWRDDTVNARSAAVFPSQLWKLLSSELPILTQIDGKCGMNSIHL